MKLFIKLLLFVFAVLIANVKVINAATTFSDCHQTTTSFSCHKEIPKTSFKVFELIANIGAGIATGNDVFGDRIGGGGYAMNAAGIFMPFLKIGRIGVQYSDDLVKAAQKAYPKLAGKIQLHHPFPKYMGGSQNQILVPLDAAYHQQITNEFLKYWSRKLPGQLKTFPTLQEAQEIMQKVYSKYPLPLGY